MFVRNYYQALRYNFMSFGVTDKKLVAHQVDGTACELWGSSAPDYLFPWKTNANNMRAACCAYTEQKEYNVRFGSGTKPASIDDVCLEKIITTGLSINNPQHVVYANGDLVESRFVYAVTNTSGEDITISEMTTHVTVYGSYIMIIDRTVLEEPITIPPGETAVVTYIVSATVPIPGEVES